MVEKITSAFPRIELRRLLGRVQLALAIAINRLLPDSWDELVEWLEDDDTADDAMATFAAAYAVLEKAVHEARARRRARESMPPRSQEN
jgi:hypothetical protein